MAKILRSSGQSLMKIYPELAPVQYFLSAIAISGLTAYIGLTEIGNIKEGDTVFISAVEVLLVLLHAKLQKFTDVQ